MKSKKEGNFFCACGKAFVRHYSLLKHMNNCGENSKKSLTNNIISTKKSDVEENVQEKNEERKYEIKKCKFCSNSFGTIDEYLIHIERIHKSKQSYFMCSVCGKQYKTKSELTHHINSKCGTLKRFKCKRCNQELMSAGSLYNHMLRHSGERSFMCRFCAKLFFTAGQLKVHERIHTHDKAYICEVCNKGFCHRQSLITHSTLHTGIKPYQCENCGNSFSCVGNLIKHRKTHADTCGLIPLTTHRVKHPSTKIKVKINTPANSRLKTREKDQELQRELDTLKTELHKKKTQESNFTLPANFHSRSERRENLTEEIGSIDNTNLVINEDHESIGDDQFIQSMHGTRANKIAKVKQDMNTELTDDTCPTHLGLEAKILDESSNEMYFNIKSDNSNDSEEIKSETTKETNTETNNSEMFTEDNQKRLKQREKKDPKYIKQLQEFMKQTNFEKQGYGDCKYCRKRYTNIRWLHKHVKEHESNIPDGTEHKLNVSLHRCSCCKKTFFTKEENLIHQQTVHADVLTCQDCDKIFANRDSLRSHQKVFHKGLGRKTYLYICEKCGKQFKQKSYLKCHEERNCDKGPFFECSICNKQFSSRHTRNNHMRIHDPEKKLLCKFCAKSFHWKGQLKIHERSHTGEKPFACLYCPKAFAYRESLITHSTIHTGIKPHLCEGCGSRFSCIGNLIKHRISHANECGSWTYKSQKLSQEVNSSNAQGTV